MLLQGLPDKLQDRLNQHSIHLRKRSLQNREGIDLSSNDYLGFSQDPELVERILLKLKSYPIGAAGSRLLRGNLEIHEEAEAVLAQFTGREAALLFPSGYQANLGLISAIMGPEDFVYSDEFNHASLIDGIRLSRAAKFIYPHNDLKALRSSIRQQSETRKKGSLQFIVTESLFSMDGDQAPLVELVSLAKELDAFLVVDESHATGLWGASPSEGHRTGGGGIVHSLNLSNQVFATIHTGGKSLGCAGAWIACDASMKEFLINFSRPFIFSTAPGPALALSLIESCKYWAEVGQTRAQKVHVFSAALRDQLIALQNNSSIEISTPAGAGPIIPIILKENRLALAASQYLQKAGYDVRAIRPPTVPDGTARLRITANYATLYSANTGRSKTSCSENSGSSIKSENSKNPDNFVSSPFEINKFCNALSDFLKSQSHLPGTQYL